MGRNLVLIGGAVLWLAFVLTQLTGSEVEEQVAKVGFTGLVVILFSVLGAAGVGLAHWQPRFVLLGAMTATLALLAGGATVVLTWSDAPSLFFFISFEGTRGTVAAVTDLLLFAAAISCVLLSTIRPDEDSATRLTRLGAIGSLAVLIVLSILPIVDLRIDIGARAVGVLTAVFVFASVTVLALRLLPLGGRPPAAS